MQGKITFLPEACSSFSLRISSLIGSPCLDENYLACVASVPTQHHQETNTHLRISMPRA